MQFQYNIPVIGTGITSLTFPLDHSVPGKPSHSKLTSVPIEIIRDIFQLSVCEELASGPSSYLKRVLTLQAVCKYFRDVLRCSPEFWVVLSSSTPRLFNLQLERSKHHNLTFYLLSSHFRDERVSSIFKLQASRWHDFRLKVQSGSESNKPLRDELSSLTFEGVRDLEIDYVRPHRLTATPDRELVDLFEAAVSCMPNVFRLRTTNFLPAVSIQTGLTTLSLIVGDDRHWAGFRLPPFIASQPNLKEIKLIIRDGPDIYGLMDYMAWTKEAAYDGKRALDVTVVLEGDSWTRTLTRIWAAMGLIGIAHLQIDMKGVPIQSSADRDLICKAVHLASDRLVVGLQTLTISFGASQTAEWICYADQHGIETEHELPSTLQMLTTINASSARAETIRALIERLVQRQAALHVPILSSLRMTGEGPAPDSCMHLEALLGQNNVCWS